MVAIVQGKLSRGEYMDTISNLSQVLHVFILLYKEKWKAQHESATCLLSTNALQIYVALFLKRF